MRGKSHRRLGEHLAQVHMEQLPQRYIQAFLIGCVEPDKNPATYLKGSLRSAWLRGHNWESSQRYITKLIRRLEQKDRFNLLDYYSLGKLVHYTTDAFTFAHNNSFGRNLQEHRQYEAKLQNFFLQYLRHTPDTSPLYSNALTEYVYDWHRDYTRQPASMERDAHYAFSACNLVVAQLVRA